MEVAVESPYVAPSSAPEIVFRIQAWGTDAPDFDCDFQVSLDGGPFRSIELSGTSAGYLLGTGVRDLPMPFKSHELRWDTSELALTGPVQVQIRASATDPFNSLTDIVVSQQFVVDNTFLPDLDVTLDEGTLGGSGATRTATVSIGGSLGTTVTALAGDASTDITLTVNEISGSAFQLGFDAPGVGMGTGVAVVNLTGTATQTGTVVLEFIAEDENGLQSVLELTWTVTP